MVTSETENFNATVANEKLSLTSRVIPNVAIPIILGIDLCAALKVRYGILSGQAETKPECRLWTLYKW